VERRSDLFLRNIVDRILPIVVQRGFTLTTRGTFGECRWVEFAWELEGPAGGPLREQKLALYHLARRHYVEVRLQLGETTAGLRPPRLAMQVWQYQAGTLIAGEERALLSVLQEWVITALDTFDKESRGEASSSPESGHREP
jgi:hypothetical protein